MKEKTKRNSFIKKITRDIEKQEKIKKKKWVFISICKRTQLVCVIDEKILTNK